MTYTKKDLISTKDLSKEDIFSFLNLAKHYKALNLEKVKKDPILKGVTVVNAFFENSTRTRVSFEIAAKRLGADAINFSSSTSSTNKGETLIDTIHNIEAMKTDVFIVRHYSSGAAKFVSKNTPSCVVNAGDGCNEHPTQALLDLLTIYEAKGSFENLTVTIIGDIFHSRVARSNIYAMQTLGIKVKLFGPPMFMQNAEVFGCEICKDMDEAVRGSDAIIMLRIQLERSDGEVAFPSVREYSKYFGLTKSRMQVAKDDVIILHPGPINRGVELNSDVADDARFSSILDQVENGVAIRMAVLKTLYQNKFKA
ncbi:aspartate carbamoyltransferase catalytic subunit [Campylobacter hyointestinalis]|uniref:aspartate carbamoyltransferase catalytic subunit n=1 Tax=Campylobacter hyointestinalis TaxID=198 RepID=UPI000DCCEB31|nr:aspartate carbamoyltransferase catalytic subunit [Campylobacter hyointestinalis]RAZ46644.1 aspartate carbamoyltransferase [Campylobacter hyointestinalis subsp. lawsonii]RAZ50664.1 aspartate carbamoyltransferase [Campylobacter hyointestinalis subsp. lawsonii]